VYCWRVQRQDRTCGAPFFHLFEALLLEVGQIDPQRRPLIEHDLERDIPYLVARAGTRMGGSFSKVLRDCGLSLSEWRVRASLGHRPHQRLSELVERACVDMSALSRVVDRLIAQGSVLREKSSADGRAVQLSLTAEGARLTRKIVPLAKHFEVTALNGFSQVQIDFPRDLQRRPQVLKSENAPLDLAS
jgi:MarR family transcriptional regulator, organic hydroperoxide resistance regulator